MKYLILLTFLIPILSYGQFTELAAFDNLVGKVWKAEGNWGDGSIFKQEIRFEYGLGKTIILTNTQGYTNIERTEFGTRNHGVRMFDKNTNSVRFWEFDIFGDLTEGLVFSKSKNIIYQYTYGDSFLTDMWEYVDDSTYNFKVGVYENDSWVQIFLSTQFKAVTPDNKSK